MSHEMEMLKWSRHKFPLTVPTAHFIDATFPNKTFFWVQGSWTHAYVLAILTKISALFDTVWMCGCFATQSQYSEHVTAIATALLGSELPRMFWFSHNVFPHLGVSWLQLSYWKAMDILLKCIFSLVTTLSHAFPCDLPISVKHC